MINGWIMLNKPKGFTSNYCINFIKKKFQIKKIGYAGTLDPLATGLLPLAIGESTKSIKYFTFKLINFFVILIIFKIIKKKHHIFNWSIINCHLIN